MDIKVRDIAFVRFTEFRQLARPLGQLIEHWTDGDLLDAA